MQNNIQHCPHLFRLGTSIGVPGVWKGTCCFAGSRGSGGLREGASGYFSKLSLERKQLTVGWRQVQKNHCTETGVVTSLPPKTSGPILVLQLGALQVGGPQCPECSNQPGHRKAPARWTRWYQGGTKEMGKSRGKSEGT